MKLFRAVSLIEGISWLLLLFVAMPLKYGLGEPMAVKILGRVHGGLFVLFLITLALAATEHEWKFGKIARAFVASLVPFGAFWLERKLRAELKQTV
jgi:integral membrane protein